LGESNSILLTTSWNLQKPRVRQPHLNGQESQRRPQEERHAFVVGPELFISISDRSSESISLRIAFNSLALVAHGKYPPSRAPTFAGVPR
jgi:hypothetical protein